MGIGGSSGKGGQEYNRRACSWKSGCCSNLEYYIQNVCTLLQERNLDSKRSNCLIFNFLYILMFVGLH